MTVFIRTNAVEHINNLTDAVSTYGVCAHGRGLVKLGRALWSGLQPLFFLYLFMPRPL